MSFGENKNTSVIVKADNYKRGFIAEGDTVDPPTRLNMLLVLSTYLLLVSSRKLDFNSENKKTSALV